MRPDAVADTDRSAALALTPVSRETAARLDGLIKLLEDWQTRVNLVASSTLHLVWTRHVADSLQLLPLAREAKTWVDLGSGGGFPGLVLACALTERKDVHVKLVESTGKKAAFLAEAVRLLDLPASVHAERIEAFTARPQPTFDVVTARALAPLPRLLQLAAPLLRTGAKGIFPKGQDVDAELTEAAKSWKIKADLIPSLTNPQARIVVIHSAQPIDKP